MDIIRSTRHGLVVAVSTLLAATTVGSATVDAADRTATTPHDTFIRNTHTRNTPTCRGVPATHVDENGTSSNDVIVITQPLGFDAGDGDDLVCVAVPSMREGARVDGGFGDDTIITLSGDNVIYGGPGNDSILSNSADHILDGEFGDDTMYLGQHPDGTVYGGDGADRIVGSPGADNVWADAGNDLILGFGGDDTLRGGPGADSIIGHDGTDVLDGQDGDDECVDVAAPATTFVGCENITAFGVPMGPGTVTSG